MRMERRIYRPHVFGAAKACLTRPAGLGLPRPNVGPQGLEGVGGAFPFRAGENVGGRHQLYVSKTGLLDSIQILSLQESAADSSGP